MKIEILGGGCKNCDLLFGAAEGAVFQYQIEAEVVKDTSMDKLLEYGVMSTPALVVDGRVLSTGRVLSKDEVFQLITAKGG